MVSSFPSPLLSLAADAIQDLDGADAITGLWTSPFLSLFSLLFFPHLFLSQSVFTKCKESIQDGRRLENISWRLWHRHLRSKNPLPISPHSPHLISPTYPLTPTSELGLEHSGTFTRPLLSFSPPFFNSTPLSPLPGSPTASPALCNPQFTPPNGATKLSPSLSVTAPPTFCRIVTSGQKSAPPVGKIICDMIPHKLDLAVLKSPMRPPLPKLDPIIVAADPGAMVVTPVPSMLLPPPTTPPPSGGLFPRVVVVNPTPHPTPPATPVPSGPPPPLQTTGQHLAPPSRLFAAVNRHNSPDATTPPNLAPSRACPPNLPTPVPVASPAHPQPRHLPDLNHPHPRPSQQPQPQPQPQLPVDETLKPSDRRFFLQQDQSPSPERDGPDRASNGSISTGKSPSEIGEPQPSSLTSNQTRLSAASTSSHPTGRGRRSKNPPSRPVLTRLNSGRHVPQVVRKDPTKARPPFHLNPDKAPPKATGSSRPPRTPVDPHPQVKAQTRHMNGATAPKASNAPNVAAMTTTTTSAVPRRGIVVSNSSSEYGTTDTEEDDDDSWASEDISEGVVDAPGTGTSGKHPPTEDEIKLREAALEAQRQRELFVKQPKRSYSNLGRTQSGLLSQLLNPDPNMFRPGHPYRVTSSQDVTRPAIPSALASGKSAAALPLAAQVTAQAPMVTATSSTHGGYRPKGRPQGEELEDESDSPDDPDDTIQLSHSLAQQRLAALANPSRRRASDNQRQTQASALTRPILPTVATAPIPLNHPWNLPAPAPPTTPRTTRRQMLATELSESLRRNLLWERQVSKTNLLGNTGRRNVLGGGGGGPRPPTTMVNGNGVGNAQAGPSQQQQQQKQQLPQAQQAQQQQRPRQPRRGSGDGAGAEDSIAERRQRALARNRTWADDFHYAGW